MPNITAVVNAASFGPGIVSGSWATILGTGLSNTTRSWMASDFVNGQLPPELDYISVTVNGKPAFIGYVSPLQLNVLIPDDVTLGVSTVQAAGQLLQSNFFVVTKVQYSPALFLATARYAAAEHLDGTLVNTVPARPGETIELFGTGFGPTAPAIPTGVVFASAAPLAQPVTATVGGVSAPAQGYLTAPGLYQVNLTVPPLPDGDAEVLLMAGGVSSPRGVFLRIAN